jgi:protein-disulfide isomerase
MKMVRPLGLALLLALGACSKKDQAAAPVGQIAAVPPPAGKQWHEVVSATPEGGMLMGNPNAAIKIVEYASYTCPHCKLFETEGAEALQQKYISTGKVSWEFRSFLIHGPDAAVTMLMNCRGPGPFFPLSLQLYAAQDDWLGKMATMTAAEQAQLQSLTPSEQFKALAAKGDLYGFFGVRGLPRAQADACLNDQAAIDKLTANQERATTQDQVDSTPTFIINGAKQAEISTWPQLDAHLSNMLS